MTFWAVAISARIITDALVVTAITVLDVLTIGLAVAAEHIRDFRPGAGHRPNSEVFWRCRLRLNQTRQQVQRAGRGADLARSYSQVLGRCSQAAMTKQQLNGPNVSARLE